MSKSRDWWTDDSSNVSGSRQGNAKIIRLLLKRIADQRGARCGGMDGVVEVRCGAVLRDAVPKLRQLWC